MDNKGWKINKTQAPDGLHLMVTAQHLKVVNDYLADLRQAVATVKAHPELANKGDAATYGMISHVPMRGMIKKKVLEMYSELYRAGGKSTELSEHSNEEANLKTKTSRLDRLLAWYVQRATKRASKQKE